MKWYAIGLMALSFNLTSFADIPSPAVDTLTVIGAEAKELAQSLPGNYLRVGAPGFMFTTETKTLVTTKALTRIVCTRLTFTQGGQVKSESCVMQKSNNGVALHP